jgi:hypothetical protein
MVVHVVLAVVAAHADGESRGSEDHFAALDVAHGGERIKEEVDLVRVCHGLASAGKRREGLGTGYGNNRERTEGEEEEHGKEETRFSLDRCFSPHHPVPIKRAPQHRCGPSPITKGAQQANTAQSLLQKLTHRLGKTEA